MAGCDMIANLIQLPREKELDGIKIKRVFAGEKMRVLDYIREHFSEGWVYEAENAIMQHKCFIATKDGQILGFACYDASAKDYFGPIGVTESTRGTGVGTAVGTGVGLGVASGVGVAATTVGVGVQYCSI